MDSKLKEELTTVHCEIAGTLAQLMIERSKNRSEVVARSSTGVRSSAAIMNPAGFWAEALAHGDTEPGEIELGLRMAASKLKAGDMNFIIESSIGQVAWLSALALDIKTQADKLPSYAPNKPKLLAMSLRAQSNAAKLMLSLGEFIKMDGKA